MELGGGSGAGFQATEICVTSPAVGNGKSRILMDEIWRNDEKWTKNFGARLGSRSFFSTQDVPWPGEIFRDVVLLPLLNYDQFFN